MTPLRMTSKNRTGNTAKSIWFSRWTGTNHGHHQGTIPETSSLYETNKVEEVEEGVSSSLAFVAIHKNRDKYSRWIIVGGTLLFSLLVVLAGMAMGRNRASKGAALPHTNSPPPPPSTVIYQLPSQLVVEEHCQHAKVFNSANEHTQCVALCAQVAACCQTVGAHPDDAAGSTHSHLHNNNKDTSSQSKSCGAQNQGLCEILDRSCSVLRELPEPNRVESLCQNPIHYQACQDICLQATCCEYPMGDFRSCLTPAETLPNRSTSQQDVQDSCTRIILACANVALPLLDQSNTIHPPTMDIDPEATLPQEDKMEIFQACNSDSITSPDGIDKCIQLCEESSCCLEPDPDKSCALEDRCVFYNLCVYLQMMPDLNNHDNIPSFVEEKCTELESEIGLLVCNTVCSLAVCCYDPNSSTMYDSCGFGDKAFFCQQFSGCDGFFALEGGWNADTIPSNDGQSSNAIPPLTGTGIEQDCQREKLTTLQGIETCKAVCDELSCCLELDESSSCALEDSCLYYDLCVQLRIMSHANHDTTALVLDKCSDLSTEVGVLVCKSVCSLALCCYDGSAATSSETCTTEFCSQYAGCDSFFEMEGFLNHGKEQQADLNQESSTDNTNPETGITKKHVDEVCAGGLTSACQSICHGAFCNCFEVGPLLCGLGEMDPNFDCTPYNACRQFT